MAATWKPIVPGLPTVEKVSSSDLEKLTLADQADQLFRRLPEAARAEAERVLTLALVTVSCYLDVMRHAEELAPKPEPPATEPVPEPVPEPPDALKKKYITAAELADVLGLTPQHIYRLAREGKIPSVQFGDRTRRFEVERVWSEWMRRGGR